MKIEPGMLCYHRWLTPEERNLVFDERLGPSHGCSIVEMESYIGYEYYETTDRLEPTWRTTVGSLVSEYDLTPIPPDSEEVARSKDKELVVDT